MKKKIIEAFSLNKRKAFMEKKENGNNRFY